ncbi:MAG: hypothetical protein QW760_06645, partial [Thermofilaceae archaeon]
MLKAKIAGLTFTLLMISACLVLAQYKYGSIELNFNNKGIVTVSYENMVLVTGGFNTWGPTWDWEDACSYQNNWAALQYRLGDVEGEFNGAFQCGFAKASWWERAWIGLNAVLIELNITATQESSFSGMAWDYDIPVGLFKGMNVTMLFANGSSVNVRLREERVPGEWVIILQPGTIGWIVPFDEKTGVVLAVFGDAWPTGMDAQIEDEREWGGSVYALRSWLFFDFTMSEGQMLRILAYIQPYTTPEEQEAATLKVTETAKRLASGYDVGLIKEQLIKDMHIEEAAELRRAQGPPLMLIAYIAVAIVGALALLFFLLRSRK